MHKRSQTNKYADKKFLRLYCFNSITQYEVYSEGNCTHVLKSMYWPDKPVWGVQWWLLYTCTEEYFVLTLQTCLRCIVRVTVHMYWRVRTDLLSLLRCTVRVPVHMYWRINCIDLTNLFEVYSEGNCTHVLKSMYWPDKPVEVFSEGILTYLLNSMYWPENLVVLYSESNCTHLLNSMYWPDKPIWGVQWGFLYTCTEE